MKKNSDFVSVIIPVKSLTYYLLYENLPEFTKQTYRKFEVIILPNEHGQYDLTLFKQYKWLRIIPTGKITRPAEKRDIGVKNAKGNIIAFIDDDAYPHPEWLEKAVALFKSKKVSAVCGPGVLPSNTNIWEKIFDEVLKSRIGAGGYSYRFTPLPKRYVDDYPSMNFLINKKIFEKLGGFNSDYWPGEDSKLCNDLIDKENGKILYDPEVLVYHHRRNNLMSYLKQHANYGYHRGAFFAHGDKNSRNLSYIIPTVFVIYLIFVVAFLASLVIHKFALSIILISLLPFFAYCILNAYLFLSSLVHTWNPLISSGSVYVLVLTHIVYGSMFMKGLMRGRDKNRSIYE